MLPYLQDESTSRVEKNAALAEKAKQPTAASVKQPTAASVKPSPAIQALDRKYANDYLKWTTEDKSSLDRNLELLRQSEAELQKELDTVGEAQSLISGNAVGRMHKSLRTEKSKKIQADVEQAALGSIKGTLSGPTSDRDVEIILSKSYDPTLSISSNLDKIRKSIGIIEATKKEKNRKAAYFEKKNGSLGGYQSTPTPESKPDSEVSAKPEETRTFAPLAPPQEGYTWMEDPNDGTRAQVPNKTVESYKAKGGRVLR